MIHSFNCISLLFSLCFCSLSFYFDIGNPYLFYRIWYTLGSCCFLFLHFNLSAIAILLSANTFQFLFLHNLLTFTHLHDHFFDNVILEIFWASSVYRILNPWNWVFIYHIKQCNHWSFSHILEYLTVEVTLFLVEMWNGI